MRNPVLRGLAGKWRKGDDAPYPLVYHLFDAATVAAEIWRGTFGPHTRKRIAQALRADEDTAGRLIAFWVGLHDIGKASPAFQVKNDTTLETLTAAGFTFPPRLIPHNTTYHNVVTAKVLPEILEAEPWNYGEELARNIATAIGGHHGTFATAQTLNNLYDDEIGDGEWERARGGLVVELARVIGVAGLAWEPPDGLTDEYPFFTILAGFTSVADWIASAEGHFFPRGDSPNELGAYWAWARQRASAVVDDVLIWKRWQDPPVPRKFCDIFPGIKNPFPLQEAIGELTRDLDTPALVIVEAPMGEGKTEAALYIADHWLRALGAEGFYVALPTMATSNQMYGRVKDFLNARLKGSGVNLHLLHSGAESVKDYAELKPTVEGGDDDLDSGVIAAEWFTSKKRGLISPFGVGTVDQALMAVLQVRHVFVRLFGLAHKVVIVDEVHAYDAYMSVLLERLLAWLAALGAPVILLSATLPREKRLALLAAYGVKSPAKDVRYPRITVARLGEPAVVCHVDGDKRRRAAVKVRAVPTDADAVATKLTDALAGGGCAAVICNTVARAQEVYLKLKERFQREELGLLHARFPAGRRQALEGDYLAKLGKDAGKDGKPKRPERFVLVGTQVLEQSLDLDFDLMVTDLAPADLVLQRMGRLHRHERDGRPKGLEEPALWLMWPPTGEDGVPDFGPSVYVYDRYILFRSWLAFRERLDLVIRVPGDLEAVVEEVYGKGELEAPNDAWAKALEDAKAAMDKELDDQNFQADIRIIKRPKYSGPLARISESDLADDAPELNPYHQALTRLGGPSVTVVCLHDVNGVVCLDTRGDTPGNLNDASEPDRFAVKRFLQLSVPLSHRGIVRRLIDEVPPRPWRKNSYLRNCRPLVFKDGRAEFGKWVIEWSDELGIVIGKDKTAEEDEE